MLVNIMKDLQRVVKTYIKYAQLAQRETHLKSAVKVEILLNI